MLGLPEQVRGADFAVDAVVGDDQRLRRSREQIDADAAEQLALRFRYIGVAGADDHVDWFDALGAERHGGDGLHAAEHVDLVGAAEMHGGDDRGMRPALVGRGAGDDAGDAGDARGNDRHMCGRDHRVAPARHVAADRVHRDVAVAEHDAGQRLHLQVMHRLFLLLREIAHLRLRELDVVEVAFRHLRNRALDLLRAQAEIRRRPVIELLRQIFDGPVLARIDLGENALHRLAHFRVGGLDRARVHSALEPAGHGVSPLSYPSPFQGRVGPRSGPGWGHIAFRTPPGSLRSPPSPEGEGCFLFNRLRIDRRAGAAGDDQRWPAEEELVDAVFGAVLGELLEIEDLAHAQAHGRDHHPVPGLVGFLGLVRPHLDAPGVRADRGDLLLLAPVAILELHARRIAAGIAAPVALLLAALHLSGAHDDEVATADLDVLILGAFVEFVIGDAFAVLEPVDAAMPRDVEQYAAADHLALGVLDAEHGEAARVDELGVMAVIGLVL